jgi:hypothetical protein
VARHGPHPESVRNLNAPTDYEAARAEPPPAVHVRASGRCGRPAADVRAATLGRRRPRSAWPSTGT